MKHLSEELLIPGPFIFYPDISVSSQILLILIAQPSVCEILLLELFYRSGRTKDSTPPNHSLTLPRSLEGQIKRSLSIFCLFKKLDHCFFLHDVTLFYILGSWHRYIQLHFSFSFGAFRKELFTRKVMSRCLFIASFSLSYPIQQSLSHFITAI